MGSDSKLKYNEGFQYKVSSRAMVLRELHQLKEKMQMPPFPFCELDCPWLRFCCKNPVSECILSLLISINSENAGLFGNVLANHISWN